MLENLRRALHTAFGDLIITRHVSNQRLAIQIDGTELVINDFGEIFAASRIGSSGLEVDVDGLGGAIPAPFPTVASSA